jgi:hypothetical protein
MAPPPPRLPPLSSSKKADRDRPAADHVEGVADVDEAEPRRGADQHLLG